MAKRHIFSAMIFVASFSWMASAHAQSCELLVKTTTPGYVPNGFNNVVYRTRILCNGTVMRGYQLDPYSLWQENVIAHLSEEALDALSTKLTNLMPGDITFPLTPGYADGPTTTYTGMNDRSEMVTFYEYSFGLWGKLESYAFAEELKQLIDSF